MRDTFILTGALLAGAIIGAAALAAVPASRPAHYVMASGDRGDPFPRLAKGECPAGYEPWVFIAGRPPICVQRS